MSDYIFLSGQEVEEVEEVEVVEEVLSRPAMSSPCSQGVLFFSPPKVSSPCFWQQFALPVLLLHPSSTLGAKSFSPLDPQWIKALPAAF